MLYGGQIDGSGKRRVQASSGTVTAFLRSLWELNGLLGGGREKSRKDHRHHAIDAAVVALTSPATIKALADSARCASVAGQRLFSSLPDPWPTLQEEMRRHLDQMIVSHRVDHRVAGPLHAESNYSKPIFTADGERRHKRKLLQELEPKEVERIADDHVKEAVKRALAGRTPKEAFKGIAGASPDDVTMPHLRAKDGRIIPIRKVRIVENVRPRTIGRQAKVRHVASGNDTLHHTAIVAISTKSGEKWKSRSVDRFEVHERLSRRGSIFSLPREGERLVMVLHKFDCIEMLGQKESGRSISCEVFRKATLASACIQMRELEMRS